jgi:hypothetical protein
VSVVNDKLRLTRQRPAVGILVCGSKNEHTVRYALDGAAQPLAVASYTYEALPEEEQQALPSPQALVSALELDNDGPASNCADSVCTIATFRGCRKSIALRETPDGSFGGVCP